MHNISVRKYTLFDCLLYFIVIQIGSIALRSQHYQGQVVVIHTNCDVLLEDRCYISSALCIIRECLNIQQLVTVS